jgi:hypothetical protein
MGCLSLVICGFCEAYNFELSSFRESGSPDASPMMSKNWIFASVLSKNWIPAYM